VSNSDFSKRAGVIRNQLVAMSDQAARSKCPTCLAAVASEILATFGAAEDALVMLARAANYERLNDATEMVLGETRILYSALADIEEGVADE